MRSALLFTLVVMVAGCGRLDEVGRAPAFSPLEGGTQHHAIHAPDFPAQAAPNDPASLWTASRMSLFGERRAARRGDILTVVIEIDDRAEISNASGRARSGSANMGIPQLFGIPQRLDARLPTGATMADVVQTQGGSAFSGDGSVARKEKLALRIAATVIEELPNGILHIEGQQEVRVNYELRELTVSGYVRAGDISRRNEIAYDRIAGARISYGGRGQISDVQQPRWGQQIADHLLPF